MRNLTTIAISKETRERLASLGSKNDSYEKIIKKILEAKSWSNLHKNTKSRLTDGSNKETDQIVSTVKNQTQM